MLLAMLFVCVACGSLFVSCCVDLLVVVCCLLWSRVVCGCCLRFGAVVVRGVWCVVVALLWFIVIRGCVLFAVIVCCVCLFSGVNCWLFCCRVLFLVCVCLIIRLLVVV